MALAKNHTKDEGTRMNNFFFAIQILWQTNRWLLLIRLYAHFFLLFLFSLCSFHIHTHFFFLLVGLSCSHSFIHFIGFGFISAPLLRQPVTQHNWAHSTHTHKHTQQQQWWRMAEDENQLFTNDIVWMQYANEWIYNMRILLLTTSSLAHHTYI